jgi:GDP-D-mannose dehydratase
VGDSAKARRILGWQAHKQLEDIVNEMVASDIRQLKGA